MAIFDFNNPFSLLKAKPNNIDDPIINISPINEQKKLEEEERARAEKSMKLRNFADTLRMVNANQSGNSQQSMMFANRLAQRKADQEARQLKAQQDMRRRDYFGDNENLLQFAEMMGDEAAYAEKLRLDALENQRIKKQNFNSVAQGINIKDYGSNREYYQALGMGYLNKGYNEEARKFLEMGKAQTAKDYSKDILSERKVVEKQYTPVNQNLQNFQKLDTALNSDTGTGAYTALVFYLRNLDGSVVKSEEVNTFQEMQGFLENVRQNLEKTKGDGMTDEVKAQLRNISAEATRLTLKGYNDYLKGSEVAYDALGLDPNLIYSGYIIDTSGINLGQVEPSDFTKEITGTIVE